MNHLNGVDHVCGPDRGLYLTAAVFLLQVQEELHQSLIDNSLIICLLGPILQRLIIWNTK